MPRCRFCSDLYKPARKMQPGRVCNKDECQAKFADEHIAKEQKKREAKAKAELIAHMKADRKTVKIRKEALKTRSDLIKETQRAVNALRRHQELAKGRGCISCGRSQEEVQATDGWKPGGAWDAGHFMSVGAMPAKRFEYRNIWLQCKSCNAGSGKYAKKGATVSKQFRANLIALEGLELVEEMERDDGPAKWTIEDLKAIKAEAVRELKELKKNG